MKIKSISEEHFTVEATVFTTEPPLNAEVFNHFVRLAGAGSPLANIRFGRVNGLLSVEALNIDAKLVNVVEEFLSHAENEHEKESHSKQQRMKMEQDYKKSKINHISKTTGLPID